MQGVNYPGLLVAFEGLGGSGKSTLVQRLVAWLDAEGIPAIATREPGGTELGGHLRTLLLARTSNPAPWTEAFLFEADRAQTYAEVVIPALSAGTVVVSDRSVYGTIAYQAFGRDLDVALIDQMTVAATQGFRPDLIFVLDVNPNTGLRRRRGLGTEDRFDEEDLKYQQRVRDGYIYAARRDPGRAIVLDAEQASDVLFAEVLARLRGPLADKRSQRGNLPR